MLKRLSDLAGILRKGPIKKGPGVGAVVREDGIALAAIDPIAGKAPRLLYCDYRECLSPQDRLAALGEVVERRGIGGMSCTLTLQNDEYQLLRVEAPSVPPEELRDAMRWRIGELVDYSPDEAALDVFPIPKGRNAGSSTLVFVAVCRRDLLLERLELFRSCHLQVEAADIQELALRNLTRRFAFERDGALMLRVGRDGGSTNIYRDGALYLHRELSVGSRAIHEALATGSWEDFLDLPSAAQGLFDSVVLEIQRSLDYYESHFATAPPKHLVMMPTDFQIMAVLPQYLGAMLGLEVHLVDFNQLLEYDGSIPTHHHEHCIGAIGSALRQWGEGA